MSNGDPAPDEADAAERRSAVRERYGRIVADSAKRPDIKEVPSCCGNIVESSCCGMDSVGLDSYSRTLGYSDDDLDTVAPGANLGLGCGNPAAIASLEAGETVLDLGSGAGFDCFLAAREVGPDGQVIGVDMTPGMVERARENAAENGGANVEFRLGEIEHLPVADGAVDVIISNCVINLSPDKSQVFDEAFRVLRPGGRLAVSDVVQTAPLPARVRSDPDSVTACVAGASSIPELESMLDDADFVDISVEPEEGSREFISEWDEEDNPGEYVVAATIEGRKPR